LSQLVENAAYEAACFPLALSADALALAKITPSILIALLL
jgi:hypothetical protein